MIPANPKYAAQWEVQSHSDPSKTYKVSQLPDKTYQCSCPQWKFRRKICKHIQEVQAGQQRQQQTTSPAKIIGRTNDGSALFQSSEGIFMVNKDGDKQAILI